MDSQYQYNNQYSNPYETPPTPGTGYPLRNSDLKQIARRTLMGHMGTMIGISLLVTVLSMVISSLFSFIGRQLFLMIAVTFEISSPFLEYALSFALNFIGSLFQALLAYGNAKAYLALMYGENPSISMLFSGFKNHPDRTILVNIPIVLLTIVLSIPSTIYSNMYVDFAEEYMEVFSSLDMNSLTSSEVFAALPTIPNIVILLGLLSIISAIALVFVMLPFAAVDYLLVEMEDESASDILRTSFFFMKGNCMRYLGLSLSFLGWILLSVFFTCGIGLIWVMPYMEATIATFYLDLKNRKQQASN